MMEPLRARIETTRRPVVRIALEAMTIDDPHVSKVGGRPYWPEGHALPRGPDGAPLVLLAQIAFREVPRPLAGYPESGLVQFFIAANDMYGLEFGEDRSEVSAGSRVVYWPTTDAPSVALPLEPQETFPLDPRRPRRMRFTPDSEVMGPDDHRFDALLGDGLPARAEAYADAHGIDRDSLLDEAWDRLRCHEGHKLGGYPYFTQTDPRQPGPSELLLQLDSDDEMMWGDVGVAGFFIDPEALDRADFRRVLYTWDCS